MIGSIADQRELASDAYHRYHDDPVFKVTVDTVTTVLVGHGPLARPSREFIALVIHTRDVLAEQCRNPVAAPEMIDSLSRVPLLSDDRIAEIKAEFGLG